jgi:hypothetical protein
MARALVTVTRLVPPGLRRRLQRLALRTDAGRRLVWREKGVEHELDFWTRWFESEGLHWPDDYRRRLDPEAPLEEELVADRLDALPGDTVAILDVGAGPLTFLGKRHPRKALELTPIDALADACRTAWYWASTVPTSRKNGVSRYLRRTRLSRSCSFHDCAMRSL